MRIRDYVTFCLAGAAISQSPFVIGAPVVASVTGVPSQGQTITISGSGFGTRQRAEPLVFDTFEGGVAGQQVHGKDATVGRWNTGSWSGAVTYATFEGRKVAKHTFGGGNYNASLYVDPSATQTVYLDFWIKAVPVSNPSRNWKSWRFYNASDNEVGNSVYYCNGGGVDIGGSWAWKAETPPPADWIHYEVIQRPGVIRHYRNGKLDVSGSSSSPPSVTQVRIGHYWGLDAAEGCGTNPGGSVYTDNVYVDTTLSRVVLGNAQTFEASTKRAIQRPVSWEANRVSLEFFPTQFASGENAYLFVVDANNVASLGFPIKVGSAAVSPNPPGALTVQ